MRPQEEINLVEASKRQIGEEQFEAVKAYIPKILKERGLPLHKDVLKALIMGASFVKGFDSFNRQSTGEDVLTGSQVKVGEGIIVASLLDFAWEFNEALKAKLPKDL